jgi:hypothetical protein
LTNCQSDIERNKNIQERGERFSAEHRKHDAQWLTELIAVAHNFTVLCGVTNAFEVAVPPDGDQLPS